MLKFYFHFSFFFFIIVALTGIWMRAVPFNPSVALPYEHVLHAHSHIAMLGFQFLAVFVIFLTLCWSNLQQKTRRHAAAICFALTMISIIMFAAFLYQGYAIFSIAMSAMHIFVEYWVAIFIYKQIKKSPHLPRSSRLFIGGSLIALLLSSLGPYALGYTSANGLKETAWFDSSVYFYLHFQYNGWLTLVTIGIFLIILAKRKVNIDQSLVIKGYWIYFIALFPSYFSNILWIEELGEYATVLSTIGVVAQWIGVLVILFAIRKVWIEDKILGLIRVTFLLLLIKSTMELGLTIPVLAELVYESRSVVIGYLHLTLLGFISIFIITLYFMTGYLTLNTLSKLGLSVFLFGFFFNEFLLFWQGFYDWTGFGSISYTFEGLLVASILLCIGILVMWISSRQLVKKSDG